SRWIRVEQARRAMPTNTGEFAARVAALKGRIDTLQARLAATEQKQAGFLARLAEHELADQQARLATYQVQARFALGTMYDRAANAAAAAAPKAPGPEQRTPGEAAPPPQAPEKPQ
ncbi:MAG TPA: hypothetical protein VFK87_04280, partial [Steroidobacteraceae bacterium]|nr:hypothetical protein [Steroidobacteraceae bacterium]